MRVWVEDDEAAPYVRISREQIAGWHEVELPERLVKRYEQAHQEFWSVQDDVVEALPVRWTD